MPVTKKELTRLTRVTMAFGSFAGTPYGREREFVCPVHHETLRGLGIRGSEIRTHRFTALQPYSRRSDQPFLLADVAEHLRRHLEDMAENQTPCDDVTKAEKG